MGKTKKGFLGRPAKDTHVDFGGTMNDGRACFLEAKCGTGRLSKDQRAVLATHAQMGAFALVWRPERYQVIGPEGKITHKYDKSLSLFEAYQEWLRDE